MDTTQPVLVTPKPFWQSKTLWFSVLTGALGVVTVLSGQYPTDGTLIVIASAINAMLRLGTTEPIR